ncbi:MAG TPA: hypothetical protein PLO79_08395 [Candidatus Marinimicrobia bacterium]|nr:hypothetical protein [Candidatus Neomarinimicrobiota bacterium]
MQLSRSKFNLLILFTFVFILFQFTSAQNSGIIIQTSLDTTIATIGDHLHLKINLRYPTGTVFELPVVEETLGQLEVIDNRLSQPRQKGKIYEQEWLLTLAVFDTGQITIPALEIKARPVDDTTRVLIFQTEPKTVQVYSVLPPDKRELKDIKPPFPLRRTISTRTILLIILLLLIAGGIWYYIRWKKAHPPIVIDEKFLDPPHIVALNQLNILKEKMPTTPDETREFYFRISEILREFLERRFFIRALEMTTAEIGEAFELLDIEPALVTEWKKLFLELDVVKYAGQIPAEKDLMAVLEKACRCVERTKYEDFLRRTM